MNATARARLVVAARVAFFALGLALAGWLVREAGADRVLRTVTDARRWLGPLAFLEAMIVLGDTVAIRLLAGRRGRAVGLRTWIGSAAGANAAAVLAPAGRAVGEAVRAAALAPTLGTGRATSIGARGQASALVANAIASAAIALVIARSDLTRVLTFALLGNAVVCATLGAAVFGLATNPALRRWLRKIFSLGPPGPDLGGVRPLAAIGACFGGRAVQAVQYGIALHAVGGGASVHGALVAQGIHLVGATVGDAIPNQMGTTEGAYRIFASSLHLVAERALAIALVVRVAQLLVATACIFVAACLRRPAVAR